jgi:hypothetical protein
MSTRTIDDSGFGVSIEEMSSEDYDAVFALLQATPGIRLGSADCREAMDLPGEVQATAGRASDS